MQAADQAREETADGQKTALNPKKKLPFPLTERRQLSHNVFLFRFGLPSGEHSLGLPVGQHVFIYGKVRCHHWSNDPAAWPISCKMWGCQCHL